MSPTPPKGKQHRECCHCWHQPKPGTRPSPMTQLPISVLGITGDRTTSTHRRSSGRNSAERKQRRRKCRNKHNKAHDSWGGSRGAAAHGSPEPCRQALPPPRIRPKASQIQPRGGRIRRQATISGDGEDDRRPWIQGRREGECAQAGPRRRRPEQGFGGRAGGAQPTAPESPLGATRGGGGAGHTR